jgi:hypothetical protein
MSSAAPPVRAYIYTVPKAGTYLMDAYLSALGMASTGWHVDLESYLDTRRLEWQVNVATPSAAAVAQPYLSTFAKMPLGSHAVGHFSPLYIPLGVFARQAMRVVAMWRHPREVLVSEFVDFRFRRTDVEFVSERRQPDSREAFLIYMREHASGIRHICHDQLLLREVHGHPDFRNRLGFDPLKIVDFRTFLDPDEGWLKAREVANFLGFKLSNEQVRQCWQQALDADNKTRADTLALPLPREALWTPEAVRQYKALGFDLLAARMGYSVDR